MTGIDAVRLNFSPESLTLLNAILSIVMFSIALDLRVSDFQALMRAPKALVTGLVSQFLVLPALTFAMLSLTNPQPSIALGLILVAACPGGNISNFITHRAGGNAALSVSMTGVATVSAILFTPLNVAFWGNLYQPTRELLRETTLDPVSIAITVFFMLILPLILGIVLNTKRPALAARIRKPMQSLSMVIFIGFIVLALAANWSFFLGYVAAVAGLVVLHNGLALAGGYLTATLAGLSDYDRRAITIETGIQNSGLGLVLIFAFFGGLGGMAVAAAFWGIWHAISGLVLASLWSRSEARR
ncbi:MAG: bile acid:sodium symporter family protein [Hoeflea sp.]|uniref:bile acid:sodium symporter family protein n=1 Tax=Hoeflea sp. TaxID=1940281 RepID=UPI0027305AF7|nr:bile acid:sodium symporter family protein [Hoeflea sp.]MDP2120884.1 bile acid:sodium symporter family protein [Hoeflea sp.]MDP3525565.1 bile acid:sodium symporter family protein [Hoeflea sp.]